MDGGGVERFKLGDIVKIGDNVKIGDDATLLANGIGADRANQFSNQEGMIVGINKGMYTIGKFETTGLKAKTITLDPSAFTKTKYTVDTQEQVPTSRGSVNVGERIKFINDTDKLDSLMKGVVQVETITLEEAPVEGIDLTKTELEDRFPNPEFNPIDVVICMQKVEDQPTEVEHSFDEVSNPAFLFENVVKIRLKGLKQSKQIIDQHDRIHFSIW